MRTWCKKLENEICRQVTHIFHLITCYIFVFSSPGSDSDILVGQSRQFWKSTNCPEPVFDDGNDYLIIGKGGIPIKENNQVVE